MKKNIFLLVIIIASFFSCKKEDPKPPIQAQTFEINSTGSTTWKYFSFANNDTVTIVDPVNSTAWDLAFQRYRIKTNGGLSGSGSGSAANSYQKGQTGFDALRVIPDTTTFALDASISIAVQQGYATYIVNPVLYTWFTLEFATQGTQIVPSDYIYIVKTGTGKYAKIWIKSYYSATNVSGYVSIQYKYQPDGSKNLE
ncbi:MAG: HmuY family protein [Bacteroidales bacterium]